MNVYITTHTHTLTYRPTYLQTQTHTTQLAEAASALVTKYLAVEEQFAGKVLDEAMVGLVKVSGGGKEGKKRGRGRGGCVV